MPSCGSNGVIHDIGGTNSAANGINDRGQIVGASLTASESFHAVLWQGGVIYDLGTLGGESSTAFAINNRGQVVGESQTAAGDTQRLPVEARDHTGGAFTCSVAGSINNRGQVVGANFITSSGQSRAFVWQDGVMTALDESDGSSSALGINARGDIAGQILPTGAVLWAR